MSTAAACSRVEKSLCFIEYQNKILVLNNADVPEPLEFWTVPIETIEKSEDSVLTVFRLVMQQVNIDLKRASLSYCYKLEHTPEEIYHIFYVSLASPPPTIRSHRWVETHNFQALNLEAHCRIAFSSVFNSDLYPTVNQNKSSMGCANFSTKSRVVINLLGTVGAGKGTQSKLLQEKYNLTPISLGDLYRDECRRKTPIGNLIMLFHATMEQATFAPDEIAYGLLVKKLSEPSFAKGFILDGFPRTMEQSSVYRKGILRPDDIHIPIYLYIDTSDVYERLTHRFICSECGIQVRKNEDSPNPGCCPKCNGVLVKRKEDMTREKIDQRLQFFKEHLPVTISSMAEWDNISIIYADRCSTPDDVFRRIDEIVQERINFLCGSSSTLNTQPLTRFSESPLSEDSQQTITAARVTESLNRIPYFTQKEYSFSPLVSYANDNFLIEHDNRKFVLRISGEHMNALVDRYAEHRNGELARTAGINPLKLLFFDPSDGLQVTHYLEDTMVLSTELFSNRDHLQKAIAALKRLHDSEISFENKFKPLGRLKCILDWLAIQCGSLPNRFANALLRLHEFEEICDLSCFELKPCHNDPVPTNFVCVGNDPFQLIDWEYSGNNDPSWDLAYFSTILCLPIDLENFIVDCYSTDNAEMMHAKMTFFKPLIHLTISAWFALQAAEGNSKLSKNQFESMSAEQFVKYEELILAKEYIVSISYLRDGSANYYDKAK